jgi:hypothetical protein
MERFNAWLAEKITSKVGTMWCAYVFAVLAFMSLPAVLEQTHWFPEGTFPKFLVAPSLILVVAWVAQTFLQLVLLSIIIVGQNLAAAKAEARSAAHAEIVEKRDIETHEVVMSSHAELHTKLTDHSSALEHHTKLLSDLHAAVVTPAKSNP